MAPSAAAVDRLAKMSASAVAPQGAFGSNVATSSSNYAWGMLAPQGAFGSNVAASGSNYAWSVLAPQGAFGSNAAAFGSNTAVAASNFAWGALAQQAAFGSNAGVAASNLGYVTLSPQAAFGSNVGAFGSNAGVAASNLGYVTLSPQAAFGSNVGAFGSNAAVATSNAAFSASNQAFVTLPALLSSTAAVVTSSNVYIISVPSNQAFGAYPSPRFMDYSGFAGTIGTVDGLTGKQLGSTGVYLLNDTYSFYNSKATAVPVKIYTAANADSGSGSAYRTHRVCIGSNTDIEYNIQRTILKTIGCETFFNYCGRATSATFNLPPKQFFRIAFGTNDTGAIWGVTNFALYDGTMYVTV